MGRKKLAVFLCALFIGLCCAQFNNPTPGQRQFLGNGQPFAGNNQQPGANQLGINSPGGLAPGNPGSQGLGGFQPNQIGGFNTIGNRFGNPFIVGNGMGGGVGGNPFMQGPGPDNQNQFTAGGQLFMSLAQNRNNYRYGTCYFNNTDSGIRGRADFRQFLFGDSAVDIRIQLVGLPPSPVDTQRGIHIHEFGDSGQGCSRVGPHFNPSQTRHGGRNSFPFLRHVGDLGNMLQSAQGVASTQFRDTVISLQGRSSIFGRSLVIKLERDDEGTGTNTASQQNGNARTPIACCTIGRASPANWGSPYSEQDLMSMSGGTWSPNAGNMNSGNQNFNNQNSQIGFSNQASQTGGTNPNIGDQVNFSNAAGSANNGQSFSFIGSNGKK